MGKIPKEDLWGVFKNDFKKREESDPNYLYFSKIKILTRELCNKPNINSRSEEAYKKIVLDNNLISSSISESIKNEFIKIEIIAMIRSN